MIDAIIKAIWKWFEALLKAATRFVFGLAGKKLTRSEWYNHAEFWKFAVVGMTSTLVQYLSYILVLAIAGNQHYLVASIISFLCSTAYTFFCNNRYVFPNKSSSRLQTVKSFFKTLMTYSVTGFVLHNILLVLFVDGLLISEYVAPIIIIIILFPVNYLLSKFWAFSGSRKNGSRKRGERRGGDIDE